MAKLYSPETIEEIAQGLERIAGGALADYEGVEMDELFLHCAAAYLRGEPMPDLLRTSLGLKAPA